MDVFMSSACDQERRTQLSRSWSIDHSCGHRCQVEHLFGNTYRCVSSGLLHICDETCDKKVPWGRCQTICLLSKKVKDVPVEQLEQLGERKREYCCSSQEQGAKKVCQDFAFDTDTMVS